MDLRSSSVLFSCLLDSGKMKRNFFGIINNDSKFCSALNHLVIIGKYFLYVKPLNGKFYIFNEFVSLARDKISFLYMLLTACSFRLAHFGGFNAWLLKPLMSKYD